MGTEFYFYTLSFFCFSFKKVFFLPIVVRVKPKRTPNVVERKASHFFSVRFPENALEKLNLQCNIMLKMKCMMELFS